MRAWLGATLVALLLGFAAPVALAAVTFEDEAPQPAPPTVRPPVERPASPPPQQPRRQRPVARDAPREDEALPPAGRPLAEPGTAGIAIDARSRCGVWLWDPQPGETVQWHGSCRGGLASGEGEMLRIIDGRTMSLHQGQFIDGRMSGPGTITFADGTRLEAEFVDGRASAGRIAYRDGGAYEGALRNAVPHGEGIRLWRTGARYQGEWVNGMRSGRGRQDDHLGQYDGMWRDDRRNGYGVLIHAGGSVYRGEWRNDRPHGLGMETYSNGAAYEGQFVNGRPEGRGVFISGGSRYEGEIHDGCLRTRWQTYRVFEGPGECR